MARRYLAQILFRTTDAKKRALEHVAHRRGQTVTGFIDEITDRALDDALGAPSWNRRVEALIERVEALEDRHG